MKFAVAFKDESSRLAVVERVHHFGLPSPEILDNCCRIARTLFRTPISFISLVAEHEIYFVSQQGLGIEKAPRMPGLCSTTVRDGVRVLRDAREQLRGELNSLVHCTSGLRFYAGVAIRVENHVVGALAVADFNPRGASEMELSALKALGHLLEGEFVRSQPSVENVPPVLSASKREEAATELEYAQARGYTKNVSAARLIGSWLQAQRYSMAMVLEMTRLYASVREDDRFRMTEKTLYRVLESGQRPNSYHQQALAIILEVDPYDIWRLFEGDARSAITKWRSASRPDPTLRVARMFYSARVHKIAICINPSVDLRGTSLLDSLGQFLMVRPGEFAELDESGLQFAYVGSDADVNFTPRHVRRCLVAIDPQKIDLQSTTEAGRLRPLLLLQTPTGLLCARVGPRPASPDQLRILPESRESAEPLRYALRDIKVLGLVREEPLLQIVLPPDEPQLKS
jgi:hypothetical protein